MTERIDDTPDDAQDEYPTLGGDISDDEDELTPSEIATMAQRCLDVSAPRRQMTMICIEFLRGNQDPALATGESPQTASGQNIAARVLGPTEVIINKILPKRNQVVSRLATAYPSMAVMPASDSDEDEEKTKASQLLLRYFWNQNNLKRKLKRGSQWLTDAGMYALHEFFNPQTGNVEIEVISPLDFLHEAYVHDVEDSRILGIRRFTTRHALIKAFPEKRDEIMKYGNGSRDVTSMRQRGVDSQPADRVETWEIYTQDRQHVLLLGSHLLKKLPIDTRKIPIQLVRYNEISGILDGVGMVETCLAPQMMRNRFLTQITENAKKMANPKIMIPIESGVTEDAFASDTGEKIPYVGGHAPTPWQPQGMNSDLLNMPTRFDNDMDDASGQAAIAQGKMVGAKSGVAIESLTENALSPLQLVQENIEEAVKDAAECVLELMKAHYTEGKMIRMFDPDTGEFISQELKSTHIVDDPQIFLEAGSLFRSEAGDRDKQTLEMFKAQLIDKDTAMRNLSLHNVSGDMVGKMKALKHARNLLAAVVQFQQPLQDLTVGDDLQSLKEVFGNYVHSNPFYAAPQVVQDLTNQAYMQIVGIIQQNAMQAANPGAPLPPPAPGGPSSALGVNPVAEAQANPPPLSVQGQHAGVAKFAQPPLGQPQVGA